MHPKNSYSSRSIFANRITVLAYGSREFDRPHFEPESVAPSPSYSSEPFDFEARVWVFSFGVVLGVGIIYQQQLVNGLSCYQRVRREVDSRSAEGEAAAAAAAAAAASPPVCENMTFAPAPSDMTQQECVLCVEHIGVICIFAAFGGIFLFRRVF